jgi:O-antigen ligase
VLALLVFLVLAPRRIPRLASLTITGVAAALLIGAVEQRPALHNGLTTGTAHSQGDEVLALVVIACAGVGLVHVAMGLATRYRLRPEWVSINRRTARGVAIALAAAVVFVVGWAAASGWASDRWNEFKNPLGASQAGAVQVGKRLQSFSGTGRYQYWQAALDTAGDHPIGGIGPGTFEFAWVRSPHFFEYARNAHSLYLETLAETGVVGLLLLIGFFALVIVFGARRAFVGPGRVWIAAATAGCVGFAAGAGPEWVWQVPAIPVAFLVLAAAVITRGSARRRGSALRARLVLTAMAVAALVPIAIQLTASSAMRASQADARAGRLGPALDQARLAADLTPSAATPELQQALVLERQRAYRAAAVAARRATAAEPNDWQLWIVRSRVEAEGGNARGAAAAFAQAHRLYPRGLTTGSG